MGSTKDVGEITATTQHFVSSMMRYFPNGLQFCILLTLQYQSASASPSLQAAFSSSPEAVELRQDTIAHAKASIDVAAYSFTSYKIAGALIDAYQRGVDVRVLLDKAQGKRHYHAMEEMQDAGVPIRINVRYAIMHDKYIIIDDKTVETGSFNYTQAAERRNAENVVVIRNKKLAREYMENWQGLWKEGTKYK